MVPMSGGASVYAEVCLQAVLFEKHLGMLSAVSSAVIVVSRVVSL